MCDACKTPEKLNYGAALFGMRKEMKVDYASPA